MFRLAFFTSLLLLFVIIPISGDEVFKYTKPDFMSIKFLDDTQGWIAGCRGIFYTNDGGETWQRQSVDICIKGRYIMDTGRIAWIDRNTILVKSDDGITVGDLASHQWDVKTLPRQLLQELNGIYFTDRNNGWGLINRSICITSDGGATWRLMPKPTSEYNFKLFPISSLEAWVVGSDLSILHTTNGGWSWKRQVLYQDTSALHFITFVNSQDGWVGGSRTMIFHTSDSGKTWQKQDTPQLRGTLTASSFLNNKEGWVIGTQSVGEQSQGVILYTNNGGVNWELQGGEIKDTLLDVQARSNGEAWVVGSRTVLRTIDHGKTWSKIKIE